MKTNLLVRHRSTRHHEMTTINSENPENKRLLTLELMLNIQRKRRSSHYYYVELITTTIVIFIFLVMGNEHWFPSSSNNFLIHGVGCNEISNPYMNSKIFIHNRTSSISSTIRPKGGFPSVNNNNINNHNNHNNNNNNKSKPKTPLIKNRGKFVPKKPSKNKKPTGELPLSQSQTHNKPNHPVITTFNANNHHNYFATAINFLMTGLSSTTTVKPKLRKQQKNNFSEPLPKPSPQKSLQVPGSSTIHPLAVLETEIKNISTERNPEGRSNLDLEYEPLYEASYDVNNNETRISNGINSPKNLHANFFDKFEDHYDDPIAEESKAPEAFADFTGGSGGTGPVVSVVKPPSKYRSPSWKKPQRRPESDYTLSGSSREIDSIPSGGSLSYDTTGTGGGTSFDHSSPSDDNDGYTSHKNVNYWPQNLNSYYGDQFTTHYNNDLYGRRPNIGTAPVSHFDKNKFMVDQHQKHQQQQHQQNLHFKKHKAPPHNEIPVNDINETSESVKKVSMMERVSVFYSEYKLFTWAIVSIVAALAAIGVLLALYLNNPPTEVVTAKRELIRSLNEDPIILKFLDTLMKHHESVHKNNNTTNKSKSNTSAQKHKK